MISGEFITYISVPEWTRGSIEVSSDRDERWSFLFLFGGFIPTLQPLYNMATSLSSNLGFNSY